MLKEDELRVGDTYFMVTIVDPLTPIVITYKYLGIDVGGPREEGPSPAYCFRYMPAFQSEGDTESSDSGWFDEFPDLFAGWGEDVPTSFSREKALELLTLDGLIVELGGFRGGWVPNKMLRAGDT